MTLDMAAGMRAGKLVVILPDPVREVAPPDPDSDDEERPVSKTNLSQNVMGLKADLMIALTRVKMPLQQASALKVGDLIDLNMSSMAQALVIDANGRALAHGTLGQIDGMRAVSGRAAQCP